MDVAVQQVVADVGGGSAHAFDKDLPFGHIKVVVQEGTALLGLPEELLGNASPELCGSGGGDGQNQHPPFNTSSEHAAASSHPLCSASRYICGFSAAAEPGSRRVRGQTPEGINQLVENVVNN